MNYFICLSLKSGKTCYYKMSKETTWVHTDKIVTAGKFKTKDQAEKVAVRLRASKAVQLAVVMKLV